MAIETHPWHWLAFGMLLVIAEMFIPSFTIFWFGLGAIVVAALLWFLPDMSLTWQLFIWAIASSLFTLLWFKYIKPLMPDRTKAGISKEGVLGEVGQVIKAPIENNRGVVRFTAPLFGADEWFFLCQDEVQVGDKVVVMDISGNTLVVGKKKADQPSA